jgi:hypothetical protein
MIQADDGVRPDHVTRQVTSLEQMVPLSLFQVTTFNQMAHLA